MALITRIKSWIDRECLTHTDLNAEFSNITDNIIASDLTNKGMIERATDAEVVSGTDEERAVTPAGMLARTGTTARIGLVQLEDSHASVLTTKAPCSKNVKEAYDKAVGVIAEHSDITSSGANIEDAVTKKHAANGDTALGAQNENLDMNTHKITGVVDPTANQEAATKKYVDDNSDDTSSYGAAYYPDYNEADQGATGGGASAKAYIDTIAANNATLVFKHNSGAATTTYTFATSETIPANIHYVVEKGALLHFNTGVTLTAETPEAGSYKIFTWAGTGKVSGFKTTNALWFGALGNGSNNDQPLIQAAINATVQAGTLTIPKRASYYKITATQLSEALTVSTEITIIINGELRATSHTRQANPPYIMNITGNSVTLEGSGILRGNGSYIATNATATEAPGLLRVTGGEHVTISGLIFKNPQQVGISLIGADHCTIKGNQFTGGILVNPLPDTAHFYIYYEYSDNLSVESNRFYMDEALGSTRQGIFGYAGYSLSITDNQFHNMHEHAIYVATLGGGIIANNIIRYTQTEGNQLGCAIVSTGYYNVIEGNEIYNALKGGISLRETVGSVVSGNNLYGVGFEGIGVRNIGTIDYGLNNNIIVGNYLKATASGIIYSGIRYYTTTNCTAKAYGGKIKDNTLDGWGDISSPAISSISIFGVSATYPLYNFEITGNTITNSLCHGIFLSHAHKTQIKHNIFYNNPAANFRPIHWGTTSGLRIESNLADDYQDTPTMFSFVYGSGGTDIWMLNNECYGASSVNPFLHSVANNVLGRGNRTSRTNNLIGTFTMNNQSSLTVNNANIAQATLTDEVSTVIITPLGANAALVMGSAKSLYVSAVTAGTSFTMATADGSAVPASNHIFAYELIQ